jgi:hypothetical protein
MEEWSRVAVLEQMHSVAQQLDAMGVLVLGTECAPMITSLRVTETLMMETQTSRLIQAAARFFFGRAPEISETT